MKHLARIPVVATLVAMVAAAGGAASAAPARQFTADFRNDTGSLIIPCVLTGSTNTLQFRVTKVNKQGPPVRGAEITTTGFNTTPGGTPTASHGSWSSSDSATGISVTGHQLIKAGSWVQVPISATAPSTITPASGQNFQSFEWTTAVSGPGGHTYTISGSQPRIFVVTDHANCPPGTTPIPTPTGGTTQQQSGAGTPCVSPTITGGVGDSLIIGTPGNDVILDLLGNNHVEGRGGNDTICTGPGNDVVLTLAGSDVSFDQGGNNIVRTSGGNDKITTLGGSSRIAAGAGSDTASLSGTKNQVRLGKGRDRATAGSGNDRIWGAAGKDRIGGGDGNNRLNGGKGNDKLRAGSGRDRMNGARGTRDVCRADGGRNRFRGCEVARGTGA